MKTKYLNTTAPVAVTMLILCGLASTSLAGEEAVETKSSGILPLPDYSGDFLERAHLLGDFGGRRTAWAEKGITFDLDYNQYFQAVTDGGIDRDSQYGGTIDFNLSIDFDRMGLIPGGLLQMRAVSRYGNSVNGISGAAIAANTDATHPTTSAINDDVTLWLPAINYTQFFSEKFALGLGKYDTYDSANEFMGGRGRSQWWNQNLTMPVSPALIIPYSTLGGVALWMPRPNLTIMGMVGTSTDTSNQSGFDNLDDGMFGTVSLTNQYELANLPGGFGLMLGYGWNGNFNQINGRLDFDDGQLVTTRKDSTWFASADFWQYLWLEGGSSQSVDISNGRQDLQGVGVFSRVQFGDNDTNPLDYCISGGFSAKGLIPRRDNDTMGIGYSYNKMRKGRFLDFIGIADSSSVLEMFYNMELSPSIHLSLDAQVSDSALPNVDTAVILGTSMQIVF